jgi:hypothetical protein
MTSKKNRPPHEVWDALEELALEEEAERVMGLSDPELDAELSRRGFDPKVIRARGAALGKLLQANEVRRARDEALEDGAWVSAPPPAPAAIRPLDRRWVVLLAAALVAASIGGGAVALGVFNKNEPKPPIENRPDAAPSSTPPPAVPPTASALEPKLQPMPPGDGKPKPGTAP